MGVKFCEWLKKLQPKGGKVALMFGNPAAENLNERGYGFRDCMMGEVLTAPTTKGRDPLTGQGGWTEVAPTFTNDDIPTANQQFADVLAANPDLAAYVLLGGWAQQGCGRRSTPPASSTKPASRTAASSWSPATPSAASSTRSGPATATSMSASVRTRWATAPRTS